MKFFLMFLTILSVHAYSIAQVNAEWHKDDMVLIDSVAKLDKNQPEEIEKFFGSRRNPSYSVDTLGFGWTKIEKGIGAGYISIGAEFFCHKGTIKTYIIYAYLPNEEALKDEYRVAYLKVLPIANGDCYSYRYNEQAILRPLDDFFFLKDSIDNTPRILSYMSPTSGITYGYTGGIGGETLKNRRLFNEIKKKLTPTQVIEIMYSINPASRLTAIEYYLRNKHRFSGRPIIDKWIEKVYQELPNVETMRGCIGLRDNSRRLVAEFSKSKSN